MKEHQKTFITTGLFLLSLCFFSRILGVFAEATDHLIGSLVLLVALLLAAPSAPKPADIRASKKRLFALISTGAALVVLVITGSPPVWIAAVCLLAFGLSA